MIQALAVAISMLMFLFVVELVRRHKLTFKYALAWLSVSAAGIFFAVFKQLLFQCAAFLGFELPSNFIFFALLCAFVFLSLLLTVFVCQQSERSNAMAQKIAILEFELKELRSPKNHEG